MDSVKHALQQIFAKATSTQGTVSQPITSQQQLQEQTTDTTKIE